MATNQPCPRCVRAIMVLAVAAFLLLPARRAPGQDKPAAAGPVAILDGGGVWRVLYSWDRPMVQTADGLKPRVIKPWRNVGRTEVANFRFMTRHPPADWTGVNFDDAGWARRHFLAKWANGEWDHRAGGGQGSKDLRQLSVRGKFTVTDPKKATDLRLTLAYRGGAIVYVNGTEIARGHLAPGKIPPGALAEIYPLKAYLTDTGKPWSWWTDKEIAQAEVYPLRVRTLEGVAVPARLLRKGANVLAVAIHAAPYPEPFATRKLSPTWSTCGLIELRLQAGAAGAVVPNVSRPAGVQVWNTNTAEELYDADWGDPHDALRPIRLTGPRNGCASGRIVVGSDAVMRNVRAKVGPMATDDGARLPASAVKAWYGRFIGPQGSRWGGATDLAGLQWGTLPWRRDDALVDTPPAKLREGAVQSVWVVAEIPAGAAPGEYRGKLTVTLEGHDPIDVPIELTVSPWRLPDPTDYGFFLGLIQCPEGPALSYRVRPWSNRHCKLVGRSLEWVGKLGAKVLYLPLTAESQYGNEQSLVVWVKGEDGKVTHDFNAVEKYVDLALKHMGKPRFVVLGVWDSCMHTSARGHRRKFPLYTLRDAAGKVENAQGPIHGSEEAEGFWRPVLHGLRDILTKRGLADRAVLGYAADQAPTKPTIGVFRKILPGVGWQATRHAPTGYPTLAFEGGGVPILFQTNVWGGWDNWDPSQRRPYGWKYPIKPSLRTWLDRGLFDASPVSQFRTASEQALLADRHGLGQIGADFWPTPGGKIIRGGTLVGRYPATSEGNLGIYAGQLLHAGPNGPVPTARYQMMRENIQECEARIFLEKLLTAKPVRLPAELAAKAQAVLDERTRWHRLQGVAAESIISWPYSGWERRSAKLFETAAEAAKALRSRD